MPFLVWVLLPLSVPPLVFLVALVVDDGHDAPVDERQEVAPLPHWHRQQIVGGRDGLEAVIGGVHALGGELAVHL